MESLKSILPPSVFASISRLMVHCEQPKRKDPQQALAPKPKLSEPSFDELLKYLKGSQQQVQPLSNQQQSFNPTSYHQAFPPQQGYQGFQSHPQQGFQSHQSYPQQGFQPQQGYQSQQNFQSSPQNNFQPSFGGFQQPAPMLKRKRDFGASGPIRQAFHVVNGQNVECKWCSRFSEDQADNCTVLLRIFKAQMSSQMSGQQLPAGH